MTRRTPRRDTHAPDLSERAWRIAGASILAVASFLRLYELNLKPLHHDEGVNGLFLVGLVRQGTYRYDPQNYHGPTLYYLGLLVARVSGFLFHNDGLSDTAIRLAPALFGIGIVGLLLCLRNELGKRGALIAAALIGVSPGAVYYSRYFIHETLFVFFTLSVVICGLLTYRKRDPRYLPVGAVAAACLCATKETAWMTLVVLAVTPALLCIVNRRALNPNWGDWTRMLRYALFSVFLFAGVFVVLYSSFFQNPQGVRDALRSLTLWTKTGITQAYHPWYLYLKFLALEEWPTLALSIVGFGVTVRRARTGLGLFAGIWAFGLLAAYTLIPYKTPWLLLNFSVPMAIVAGCSAALWDKVRGAGLLLIVVLTASLVQTVNLNFRRYDDEREPYVYVHTTRQIFDLMDLIHRVAVSSGAGNQLEISITSPEYWPLPWYLRDYTKVGYWGREFVSMEAVVIGSGEQDANLQAGLSAVYRRIGSYALRPGVTLVVFVRKDIQLSAGTRGDVQFALNVTAQCVAIPAAHPVTQVPAFLFVGVQLIGEHGSVHVDVPAVGEQGQLVRAPVDGARGYRQVPPFA